MADVKVKALTATSWNKKRIEAGETLEIPEEVAEVNPTIFEIVKETKKARSGRLTA